MNILTFDIEDWYCHDDYSQDFDWDKHEVRVYEYTDLILEELEKRSVQATFFCLGWLAEKHPSLILNIAKKGHHIGCHSYQHQLASRFTEQEFKEDTRKAKILLEDLIGKEVNAFRVPSFSITKNNKWTFEILAEQGFKYDCSIFPSVHEFGGFPDYPAVESPSIIRTSKGDLKEFPINLGKVFGQEVIFSGGGYFKLLPYSLIKKLFLESSYNMVYLHPSNFDAGQPHMRHLPLMRQFKNRVGLSWTLPKFRKLLDDFSFCSLDQADSITEWEKVPVIDFL